MYSAYVENRIIEIVWGKKRGGKKRTEGRIQEFPCPRVHIAVEFHENVPPRTLRLPLWIFTYTDRHQTICGLKTGGTVPVISWDPEHIWPFELFWLWQSILRSQSLPLAFLRLGPLPVGFGRRGVCIRCCCCCRVRTK